MTKILISSVQQLADAQAFVRTLKAFETGSGPLPDRATIQGEGEDGQASQVMFVAPGDVRDTMVSLPLRTTVVNIATSRDLDELNSMVERMQASDVSTEMRVSDVVVAIKPGALDGGASLS
jgi:hypothetical protein